MIPLVDLNAQYRALKPEILSSIERVLDSSEFILGSAVTDFEARFAEYCGAAEAVGVNSGTSALHLALLACGIGAGDEVITVPFTFVATVSAIGYTGARAVFVDVDPQYYTMDPARVEAAITPRTKAILPVHLYGQPADMDPILDVARRHGLAVIEDAAQAHGARYKDRPCGSMGAAAAFSFYPGKNLGAYGEGGAVVSSDPGLVRTTRMLRDWGQARKYEHTLKGFNYRMDGIQGAVLGVKLTYLERWTELRRARADSYGRALADLPLERPRERPDSRHVFHVYTVRVHERDRLRTALAEKGIHCGVHYPIPVHLQPAHADLGYRRGDFPVAEQLAAEVLSLPMYPELTDDQVAQVASALRDLLA